MFQHYQALLQDYTLRTGKIHGCSKVELELAAGVQYLPDGDLETMPNCARDLTRGLDFTKEVNVFSAYRRYLKEKWKTDKLQPKWG